MCRLRNVRKTQYNCLPGGEAAGFHSIWTHSWPDRHPMLNQKILKRECIQLWRSGTKQRTIASAGLSMRPLIFEGSTLTFKPCTSDRSIAVGDIVLFERKNILIAHRIIGIFYQNGSLWFREKGDNTFLPGCFPAESLIGRVVKIEYNGKVRGLTGPLSCIAGRVIGVYWGVLFALLRYVSSIKRKMFVASDMPRLRSYVFHIARFLNRLPTRFTKR